MHALVCAITMSIGSAATAQMLWWPEVESGATRLSQGQNEITCAMFNDALKCWGKNIDVGLGDGSITPRYAPNLIFPGGVSDVATGVGADTKCKRATRMTIGTW